MSFKVNISSLTAFPNVLISDQWSSTVKFEIKHEFFTEVRLRTSNSSSGVTLWFYCINFTPLNRVCESFKSLLGQMKRRLHIWEPPCWLSYLWSRLTTRLRTQTLFWTVSRVTSACRTFRAWEREDELKIWKFRCEGSQRGRRVTHHSANDLALTSRRTQTEQEVHVQIRSNQEHTKKMWCQKKERRLY